MSATGDVVTWHEVECAAYAADLALWEELAEAAGGPILELGCGTGRVALHLARAGYQVVGIDADAALVSELNRRAADAGVPARAAQADAISFELGRSFPLVVAPMQLIQLLPGEPTRRAAIERVAAHLSPHGRFAAALVENRHLPDDEPAGAAPPLPDVREQDGWVFSSLPRAVRVDGGRVMIERLRQAISPDGALAEEVDITHLSPLSATALESEAREAGLRLAGSREIVATHWHVGSTVLVMESA